MPSSPIILSFIVPIYNTAIYLDQCILSMIRQDIPQSEYEVILIDDGSTDNSLEICRKYADKNSNFTILTQPNSGQAKARNRGLEIAKGKYIRFVDSDDYIKENSLAESINLLETMKLDILAFCAENRKGEKTERRQSYPDFKTGKIIEGAEFLQYPQYQNCVPFYFYRNQFLKDHEIRFYEGIFHEDNEILPRIFYPAQRVSICNEVLYYVNLREGSTIRSVNPKKAFDLILVARSLATYIETAVKPEDAPFMTNFVGLAVNGSLLNTTIIPRKDSRRLMKAWKENRDIFKIMKKAKSLYYKCEALLFYLFPKLSGVTFRTLHSIRMRRKKLKKR